MAARKTRKIPKPLAGHLFTGPFAIDTTEVRANQVPVVYAIIAKGGQSWAPVFRVVDVGAGADDGIRFTDHPRRREWAGALGQVKPYNNAKAKSDRTE